MATGKRIKCTNSRQKSAKEIRAARRAEKKAEKANRRLGFTNRLALLTLLLLAAGLAGGFILAWRSIEFGYTGALACFTVCFTPLGTALSIVLSKIVDKNKAENTVGGIKYETVMREAVIPTDEEEDMNSPAI